MKHGDVTITISGLKGTGRTYIGAVIERALREKGYPTAPHDEDESDELTEMFEGEEVKKMVDQPAQPMYNPPTIIFRIVQEPSATLNQADQLKHWGA